MAARTAGGTLKNEIDSRIGFEVRSRRWNYGFHWVGRDKTGLSRWQGDRSALKVGAIIADVIGCGLIVVGSGILLFAREPIGPAIMGAVGFIHLGLARWMKALHARLTGLLSIEEVAATTNVDNDALARWAAGQNLKPRAMINGEYLYDPADFGEAATLLRSADAPAAETLLRTSESAATDNETLLHPICGDAGGAPILSYEQQEDEVIHVGRQE
jgi:hypothetical protein